MSQDVKPQGARDATVSWDFSSQLGRSSISPFQRGNKVSARVDGTHHWLSGPLYGHVSALMPLKRSTPPLPPLRRSVCVLATVRTVYYGRTLETGALTL